MMMMSKTCWASAARRVSLVAVVSMVVSGPGAAFGATPAVAPAAVTPAPGVISTVAGGATPTTMSQIPVGVAVSGSNIYIADANGGGGGGGAGNGAGVVRRLNASTNVETVVAGNGGVKTGSPPTPLGDGGPATLANLSFSLGSGNVYQTSLVATDGAGDLFILDFQHQRVREVPAATGTQFGQQMTSGYIYTVAGDGTAGFSGDNSLATQASINATSIAVDTAGDLFIADGNNHRVREVPAATSTHFGVFMGDGYIYTVAGNGATTYTGDGSPATSTGLVDPTMVAVNGAGNNLLIGDGNTVREVSDVGGTTHFGITMTTDDIYTVAGTGAAGYSGDGGPALSATVNGISSLALDSAGNLLIGDAQNGRVREVAATNGTHYGVAMIANDIYTVAGGGTAGPGDGGPATSAELSLPSATTDNAGDLFIASQGPPVAEVQEVPASSGTQFGQSMTLGDIYDVSGGPNATEPYPGPPSSAQLNLPYGVTVDKAGDEFIADSQNNRVLEVPATSSTQFGQSMTAGDIYTVAGNGITNYTNNGNTGNNIPAVGAELGDVPAVAVDGAGNLLVLDAGPSAVRVVAATSGTFYGQAMTAGNIYTVAGGGTLSPGNGGPATSASLSSPNDIALDASGNLFIAEGGTVQEVAAVSGTQFGQAMTAGDIYTVAGTGIAGDTGDGGPAVSAQLNAPLFVAVDGSGNLLISDTSDNVIREVPATTGTYFGIPMTADDIYKVVGNGTAGYSGDGGPPTAAELNYPQGMTFDATGNLIIADGDSVVREVPVTTGTYFGIPMTADDIYTVAGNTTNGYSGDGGPATSAELYYPEGVAVDGSGNLLIADAFNNVIREVQASPGPARPPSGGSYVPLAPSRIVDSRTGLGGVTTLAAQHGATVTLPSSVPVGATSVALNVTAVDATVAGYLSVYPSAAGGLPPLESSLNFVAGPAGCAVPDCVAPNLVITKVSAANKVTVYNGSGGTVDVVVDLEGYFNAPSATTGNAGHYYGLAPARVADTRCGDIPPAPFCSPNVPAVNSHPALGSNQSFNVTVAGQGGVPATGAAAAVVQLTATNPTTIGYLTAYPAGSARPTASNVNFVAGQTTSTRAIVPLGTNGAISVYNNNGRTDVVVDVVGYLSDGTGSLTGGSLFNPVNPSRLADTRPGSNNAYAGTTLGAHAAETVRVAGVGGIPASVNGSPTAAALNVTEATATAVSFLTVTPTPLVPPATTSDVNFAAGETRANADLAALSAPGSLSVYNDVGRTDFIVDAFGYFATATNVPPTP
jgi:hypothetical protein